MKSIPLTSFQLRLLAVLALINFVNFVDRQAVPPLVPLIRDEFNLTSTQISYLQVVLQGVLALGSIPFGFFADRFNRSRIIAGGVIFWSFATIFTSHVHTFTMLLLARAFVGMGEAAYAPAAQSMISGAFPHESRARAQAIFASGMLIGGTAGQALAGIIGQTLGWRATFYVIGIPGLLLSFVILGLAEPPRGPRSEVVPITRLIRVPAFFTLICSGIMITFASVAFLTWGTDFVVRYKDFSVKEAGVSLGLPLLISALFGVLAGGLLADIAQKRFAFGRIFVVACGFICAAPFILWAIISEEKHYTVVAFFIAGFFMSWYHGPVTAIIHDMMPRRAHASSVGVYMFATQLLGGILGPYVVGRVDDLSNLILGLQIAVLVMVCGALLLFLVIYFIRRDGLRHPQLEAFHIEIGD
ncbi:MAG TPA: MFS transporter [Candidatus Dormibacteraeota bacterium]|nr:MFS transporter [Candidatus Dormibacteraeota bacterium]